MGVQKVDLRDNEVFGMKEWRLNRFMLKTVGLWPYQKRYTKLSIQITLLIGIYTMMIPQVIRCVEEWGNNFEIVIENITGFFYFQVIIAKCITCNLAESKLKYLYQQITIDWSQFTDEGELNILRTCAYHGRLLTLGYTGYSFLYLPTQFRKYGPLIKPLIGKINFLFLSFEIESGHSPKQWKEKGLNFSAYLYTAAIFFTTLPGIIPALLDVVIPLNVSRRKVLCFYGEYFIDQDTYYYQLLLHTFVIVISTVTLFTSIDTTYACCAQHVVALFNIVDYRLRKALELQDTQDFRSEEIKEKIHNYVLSSIEVYNFAKFSVSTDRFADLLQVTYTTCFFLCTGATIAAISLGTVDVMMSVDNLVNLARLTFAWLGIVIYLFYVSFPGQQIIDASSEIFNSVYFCGWYNFPLKTQYLLKFMMMRSRIPCEFTAGPLFVMNIENCGVVLKTAMSYCTFIVALS